MPLSLSLRLIFLIVIPTVRPVVQCPWSREYLAIAQERWVLRHLLLVQNMVQLRYRRATHIQGEGGVIGIDDVARREVVLGLWHGGWIKWM